jgi:hypothetical protein
MIRLGNVALVACLLCGSALAGDIPSVGAPQPQSQQTTSPTLLGEIPTSDKAQSLSDAALSAILTALGLASI